MPPKAFKGRKRPLALPSPPHLSMASSSAPHSGEKATALGGTWRRHSPRACSSRRKRSPTMRPLTVMGSVKAWRPKRRTNRRVPADQMSAWWTKDEEKKKGQGQGGASVPTHTPAKRGPIPTASLPETHIWLVPPTGTNADRGQAMRGSGGGGGRGRHPCAPLLQHMPMYARPTPASAAPYRSCTASARWPGGPRGPSAEGEGGGGVGRRLGCHNGEEGG